MNIRGGEIYCGGCGETVYENCQVIANHTITELPDGRYRWYSRDFNIVVHLCAYESVAAEAEAILAAV